MSHDTWHMLQVLFHIVLKKNHIFFFLYKVFFFKVMELVSLSAEGLSLLGLRGLSLIKLWFLQLKFKPIYCSGVPWHIPRTKFAHSSRKKLAKECLTLDFSGFELPLFQKEINKNQKIQIIKGVSNPLSCCTNIHWF